MKSFALIPLVAGLLLFAADAPASVSIPQTAAPLPANAKVLRLGFGSRENNFDPAQISDVISAALVASLFDAPLTYDQLARPVRLKPNTAAAMPEVDAEHKHFVFTIQPGIHFGDDPAFGGKPRELIAADYVYSIKRYYDPATRSPTLFHFEGAGLLGLTELRQRAIKDKTPFDYDSEVAGIRVLDRYRFEVRVSRPAPRLLYVFANPAITGALAREVVEAAKTSIGERPVGTGPFRLAAWTRGTRIVLDRNPAHRHRSYDEQPAAGDVAGQAIAAHSRGRSMPMLDRVEISVVEEAQPRWLSFLNGQLDMVGVPNEFVNLAAPNRQVAPHLARRGVRLHQQVAPTTWYTYFNMDHPLVGGYTPERVALRRAIGLAYDVRREIDLVRRNQAVPAQSVLPPGVSGFDAGMKSEMSDHDLARAKALLDIHGYVDRDGDGWREQPDGQPLVLELTAQPDQASRALQDLWSKAMVPLGLRITFRIAAWQENIKASRAGKLMMWGTGWSAAIPDGSYFLEVLYGPNKGQSNHSRFNLPEYNQLHERQRAMADGPERDALIQQALRLSLAYMPLKATAHPIDSWLTHKQVLGYRPHPFIRDYW
ncbi:MAG: ABC transporter substrate-binding protein, partial [Rubrivivax sp.]|nr:ABC transporter substrate-binding protein [Rubrivivax sp.]